MLSWIVFPIYDLVGASLVRSGASRSPAARVGPHSGTAMRSGLDDRDRLGAGPATKDSNESLSDSDPTADEDDRCKFCLGTNCGNGVLKAARNVAQNSFLKKFIFWK